MSDCIDVEIKAYKGATLVSPNFFSIEETAPEGATIADIERGIAKGIYTVVDPNLYTYKGMIKAGYDQEVLEDLNISISTKTFEHEDLDSTPENPLPSLMGSYDVVTFKVLPTNTNEWNNKEYDLFFDIKRTEIIDPTNIDIWVKGTIKVQPVITE